MFRNLTLKLPAMLPLRSAAVILLMFQTVHAAIDLTVTVAEHTYLPGVNQVYSGAAIIGVLGEKDGLESDATYKVINRVDTPDAGTAVFTIEEVSDSPSEEETRNPKTQLEMNAMNAALNEMGHQYYVDAESANKVGDGVLGSKVLEAKGYQLHPNSNPVEADRFYTVTDKRSAPDSMPGMTLLTLQKQNKTKRQMRLRAGTKNMIEMRSALSEGTKKNVLGKRNILVNEYVNVRVDLRAGQIMRGCGKTKLFGIVQELPPKTAFDVIGKYKIKILDGPTNLTGTTREFSADKVTRAPKDKVTGTETVVYFLPTEKFGMQRVFVPSTEEIKMYAKKDVTPFLQDCSNMSRCRPLMGRTSFTAAKTSRRRRVMERLLRYENHYSSGAEGYPPKDPYYSA